MEPLHEFPTANGAFPYDAELAAARRYLASRGITEPKPLYHSFAPARPAPRSALRRARARWFADARRATAADGSRALATANAPLSARTPRV